jgi:hypothetical protein
MIKLTVGEISILGRPNFACAPIGKILIDSGIYEKGSNKAEYEQAVYIHWALGLLKEHGDNWIKVGNEIIAKALKEQGDEQK